MAEDATIDAKAGDSNPSDSSTVNDQNSGSDKGEGTNSDTKTDTSKASDDNKGNDGEKGKEEEKVPFHKHPRWKKMQESNEQLMKENDEFKKSQIQNKQKLPSEEELAMMTPDQLIKLGVQQSEAKREEQKLEDAQQQKHIDQELDTLRENGVDVDVIEDELVDFAIKRRINSLVEAYKSFEDYKFRQEAEAKNNDKAKEEKEKKEKSAKSGNSSASDNADMYKEMKDKYKGKSTQEIVRDLKKQFG